MSASLEDIWNEPLADPPLPPQAPPGLAHPAEEDDEEDVFRPTKRRRSTLFLGDSDQEGGETPRKSISQKKQPPPDIDALFEDLEEPTERRRSKASKPFDLAALRRDAQARAEKDAPQSSYPQYAVQSSSPPREGLAGQTFGSGFADETGPSKKRELPKLNEDRLLGKDGFSALIRACRDLNPKGKGHELADLNRLFSLYQFWTHKLYPKTQFSDTTNRIEKLCHSKRMHSALLGWRDEFHGTINGKKFLGDEDIDMHSDHGEGSGDEERRQRDEEDVFGPRRENTASSVHASSSRASSPAALPPVSRPPSSSGGDVALVEDDDPFDIDALLLQEEEMRQETAATSNAPAAATVKTKGGSAERDFVFDEDEDALWAALRDNAFDDIPPPDLGSDAATSNGLQQTLKSTSKSGSDWDDNEAWDILDELGGDHRQPSENTDSSTLVHSFAETLPESTVLPSAPVKPNGSAVGPGHPDRTPSKDIRSTDDDWEDMYV